MFETSKIQQRRLMETTCQLSSAAAICLRLTFERYCPQHLLYVVKLLFFEFSFPFQTGNLVGLYSIDVSSSKARLV